MHWHENAAPLTRVRLQAGAVSTSGGYERGASHLLDPRTGSTAQFALSATVVAPNAGSANALSTALCVMQPEEGLRLVEATQGAAAIIMSRDGRMLRSQGIPKLELPVVGRLVAATGWPGNYQIQVTLTLRAIEGYRVRRPYEAVWAEDMSGKLIRNITVWTERRRWLPDLFEWWKKSGSAGGGASVTRATRPSGRYQLLWDGLDDDGQPVGPGKYRIVVESNREHGGYAKESAVIECGTQPAKATTKENGEFAAVEIAYGPVSQSA
ncbi:MAG: DUF2271 domain-containing protein [Acidobacteria bacterium]|nr:DUF2271 domain-containing protein [Acidobacteriota bacterium]